MTFQRRQNRNLQKGKTISHLILTLSSICSRTQASHLHQHVSIVLFVGPPARKQWSASSNTVMIRLFQVHWEGSRDFLLISLLRMYTWACFYLEATGNPSTVINNTWQQSTACKLVPRFDIKLLRKHQSELKKDW